MKYVIAGAGPSGVTAAETLRKNDQSSEIILIDGENHRPYGRMALPYLLTGEVDEFGLILRKKNNYFQNLKIKIIKSTVESVSAKDNSLILDTGQTITFDKLLIATGSHPIKPNIEGLDLSAVYHCWTVEDARNIANKIGADKEVVLIGAGFIGCIIMEAIFLSGSKLTVVEASDRMVPGMMNKTASNLIKNWCETKGIYVFTSAGVMSVESRYGRLIATINDGTRINADLIIVATGVSPNINFLEGSGVEIERGVKVDDNLKTNIDNIYAAGDVAQGPDFSSNLSEVHAIQPTGVEHGRVAGLCMAGMKVNYRGSLNMNILDTMGLVSCSFGLWKGAEGGEHATNLNKEKFQYILLNFSADNLVGAITVGRTNHVGILRGLIQTPIKLGKWKDRLINNPSQIVEAYISCVSN